jgi:single-stranded DNA-binding protein
MNSCILMAEVIEDPQLRYTPDNQTPIAEMQVQFSGLRDDDPPATLKVVGWGNLAQEIQERYHQGDRVIVEGRLTMSSFDRPEGFKEKRAELTAQRIHLLGAGDSISSTSTADSAVVASSSSSSVPSNPPAKAKPSSKAAPKSASEPAKTPAYSAAPTPDPVDYDDIPF